MLFLFILGDNYCDDDNNNAGCQWDGGDCCGTNVNTEYCSDCKCYKVACAAGIVPHPMVGDGFCNDEANHLECNYDGGDCCGSCVVKLYCSDCECLGGYHPGNGVSSPSIGDGICHDDNNIAACGYDGLDCCSVSTDLIGNGFCNDETNNPYCNYDGGDCCLLSPNTDQCSQCVCSTSGAITSPGYPQNYDNNLDLSWLIVVPIGQTIEINFIHFAVEFHLSCG